MKELCLFLLPFDQATKTISGGKYPTIYLVIPLICEMLPDQKIELVPLKLELLLKLQTPGRCTVPRRWRLHHQLSPSKGFIR